RLFPLPERRADLSGGQAGRVALRYRVALRLGQRSDELAYSTLRLRRDRGGFGSVTAGFDLDFRQRDRRRASAQSPIVVDGRVSRDPEEPRTEARASRAVASNRGQRALECRRGEVDGVVLISAPRSQEAEDVLAVPRVQN